MFEIELKAHLADRSAAADRISGFADYAGFTEKHDTYWLPADTGSGMPDIRVRETGGQTAGQLARQTVVTFKKRELRDDVEINNETEFTVSGRTASGREEFEILLRALGFVPGIRKHKSTSIWRCENALIEISAVEGLGDFIEIEILSETNDPETIETCTRKLHDILARAGVPETAIERRYYTQMLSEAQGKR
ncbi:MAG: class IV adenylate cyclase [Spirochaetaceae bacterium]|jgi:adenylate cyclase class 2|nr:class IV adenylate cyclase [Spirochaetaceae bacterium]